MAGKDRKIILILGGSGNTGRPLARLLLQETGAELVLAGRNVERAAQVTASLNQEFGGNRVKACYADASDEASLRQAFAEVDLVVVASSTTKYVRQVASAALESRASYLDIQYSSQKIAYLRSITDRIHQSGCCFITDGGFHPGLPAFMVRYIAQYFDRLRVARVGSVIKEDWSSLEIDAATTYELMELMNDYELTTYKDGKWKKVSLLGTSDFIGMDFGSEFGRQYCYPMLLEEMRQLPAMFPSLQTSGFFVGSFNWFVDWLILPLAMVAMKLSPEKALKPMARWMYWGLRHFSRPPYGTRLKVEASGEKNGLPKSMSVTISHPDGYLFTAIPVAACLLQVLDGTIGTPGLWLQAHVVEPNRFIHDMQRMGIHVTIDQGAKDEVEQE